MFSQLPMISKLLLVILILFILQFLGGYYQVKNYRATVRQIHKLGNVGIGQKKGKFFNGNIVMVASDGDGIIKGVAILDGITFLSKFHSVDEFLGKPLVGNSIYSFLEVTDGFDKNLMDVALDTKHKVIKCMSKLRVADAMTEIFNLFKRCNKYIDETMPWALAKDPAKQDRLATVLYNLVESITIGASLLSPFMPETAERIFAQLNSSERTMDELEMFGLYESGKKVTDKPEILFARLDAKEVQAKVDEMNASRQAPAEEEKKDDEPVIDIEPKEEITFDDFEKMQFQVGEIIACEEVKKSKKLLCSQVKIGSQVKQIVSGIKKHYSAEEMVGKKVMVLVNLKPAKLAGVLSEGMLLCAEDENGELSLMVPEKKMPAGAEIC